MSVLNFGEYLLEFCHTADAFLKEWAGEIFLGDAELIGLWYFVDIGLWLVDLDEGFKDVDDSSWYVSVNLLNFNFSQVVKSWH